MSRGVRQGCPLSGLLFVLAIKVLAQAIRENENIHGLNINDTELKLSMYADDLTAFIKDERSASHLYFSSLQSLCHYCKIPHLSLMVK